jgi:hypothetical protein
MMRPDFFFAESDGEDFSFSFAALFADGFDVAVVAAAGGPDAGAAGPGFRLTWRRFYEPVSAEIYG